MNDNIHSAVVGRNSLMCGVPDMIIAAVVMTECVVETRLCVSVTNSCTACYSVSTDLFPSCST